MYQNFNQTTDMNQHIKTFKQYLFNLNTYFQQDITNYSTQISFHRYDTEFTIFFVNGDNMLRMLINGEIILKTFYSEKIEELIDQIAIYCKQQECQQHQIAEISI